MGVKDAGATETARDLSARQTREWYARYGQEKGHDRNDLLRNPGVLLQYLAYESSVISAVALTGLDPAGTTVLDVGCGTGSSLLLFLRIGIRPEHLVGLDIQDERIAEARRRLPALTIECGDASQSTYADGSFDIVSESTMFVQLTDEELAARIANEMLRVTRTGGYILLADWRYSRPGDARYAGLSPARIRRLFHVGTRTRVRGVARGSLIPPVGRFLSRFCRPLYFPAAALFPPLVGQVVTVLEKLGVD